MVYTRHERDHMTDEDDEYEDIPHGGHSSLDEKESHLGGHLNENENDKVQQIETEKEGEEKVEHKEAIITLEPFVHQVGGHCKFQLLDSNTICKPLIARELHFYRTIPKEIKQFTPIYKGVIEVSRERDFVRLRNVSPSSSKTKTEIKQQSLSVKVIPEESARINRLSLDNHVHHVHSRGGESCSRGADRDQSYFLMLENVASQFYRPCILDLKMGVRQHGDDVPEEKRLRHMAKCSASTSATLGVRVCGMQVYQADLGMYLCKDKYYGRRLDEDGFKHALHEFFFNGFIMRSSVVCSLINQLKQLRKILEKQNSCRFYSSSLLIVYEGCCIEGDQQEEIDQCSINMAASNTTDAIEDHGINMDAAISNKVQVRMIDFAHTTSDSFGDSIVHRGPDNGYIFGLDNLCRLLKDILDDK